MKSALFVQINVAVDTDLTSKELFVFPKHIFIRMPLAMLLIVN